MKKNIIALRRFYKDGSTSLFGNLGFYVGDEESEKVALALAAYEAQESLKYVTGVNAVYVDCEWNFEVDNAPIISEYELTSHIIEDILSKPLPCISTTGNTLEILPDTCYNNKLNSKVNRIRRSHKCTDWTKQNSDVEWDNNSWWYLHGELENQVGYDKATIINATKAGDTVQTIKWLEICGNKCTSYRDTPYRMLHINGIRDCNVIGINAECLGFFWTTDERTVEYDKGTFSNWDQRGLVVQKSDTQGILQAYHAYLMRTSCL